MIALSAVAGARHVEKTVASAVGAATPRYGCVRRLAITTVRDGPCRPRDRKRSVRYGDVGGYQSHHTLRVPTASDTDEGGHFNDSHPPPLDGARATGQWDFELADFET